MNPQSPEQALRPGTLAPTKVMARPVKAYLRLPLALETPLGCWEALLGSALAAGSVALLCN